MLIERKTSATRDIIKSRIFFIYESAKDITGGNCVWYLRRGRREGHAKEETQTSSNGSVVRTRSGFAATAAAIV